MRRDDDVPFNEVELFTPEWLERSTTRNMMPCSFPRLFPNSLTGDFIRVICSPSQTGPEPPHHDKPAFV